MAGKAPQIPSKSHQKVGKLLGTRCGEHHAGVPPARREAGSSKPFSALVILHLRTGLVGLPFLCSSSMEPWIWTEKRPDTYLSVLKGNFSSSGSADQTLLSAILRHSVVCAGSAAYSHRGSIHTGRSYLTEQSHLPHARQKHKRR